MRLAVGLLVVALGSSLAWADAPPPAPAASTAPAKAAAPKVALRVVRVMPESHQALLFDRDRGTHVLAEVGQQIDGFRVDDISDDTVTLSANGTAVVLAAPDRSWRHQGGAAAAMPAPAAPADPYVAAPADPYAAPSAPAPSDPYAAATIAPSDPYAPTTAEPTAPVDPYGAAAVPVRVVEAPAPITLGEDGIRTVDAGEPAGPSAILPPVPPPPAITTAPLVVPAAAPAVEVSDDPGLALSRTELGAELADFTKLSAAIHATFSPGGIRIDSVATGSLFARAGLRAGDIISAVDGQPLRSLDDAADLYARASSTRNLSITVVRAGKPVSLHVTIK